MIAAIVAAVFAFAAPPPGVIHIGPPTTWSNVKCSRVTLRDTTQTPTRVTIIERCYPTRPVDLEALEMCSHVHPCLPCTFTRPCPV